MKNPPRYSAPGGEAHTVSTLPGGLRLISREMPGMESIALGLWVGAGGRHEARAINGISHFLEHILFKGTKRRSARDISRAIESVGGALNAFTSEEYTCYLAKVPRKHLRLAADLILDIYLNPALRSADVEREKTVVREEINMALDTPHMHVLDLMNSVLWGDHPLGRPLIGTVETVSRFTPRELAAYLQRHYKRSNTVIAVAGRIRHDELLDILLRLLPSGGAGKPRSCIPARDVQRSPALLLHRKRTEQTHLSLGIRAYRRDHPDRYALQLLSIVLGENMSSRLFQEIRERRGLAYAIHSSVIRYSDTGALTVYAGVEHGKFTKTLALITGELRRLRDKGIRPVELARAKEYWRGQLSMELEKTVQSMIALGENLLCSGRVLTLEETLSNISAVRIEDVERVAADIFRDRRLNLAAIGPLAEKDGEIEAILHL